MIVLQSDCLYITLKFLLYKISLHTRMFLLGGCLTADAPEEASRHKSGTI